MADTIEPRRAKASARSTGSVILLISSFRVAGLLARLARSRAVERPGPALHIRQADDASGLRVGRDFRFALQALEDFARAGGLTELREAHREFAAPGRA